MVIKDSMIRKSKLVSLKTALMQDLLSGKKRVTPLLNTKDGDSINEDI